MAAWLLFLAWLNQGINSHLVPRQKSLWV